MPNYDQLIKLLEANNFNTKSLGDVLSQRILPDSDELDVAFDLIIENQRGLKLFGIPLFSRNSLLPLIDPPLFQRLDGTTVSLPLDKIENYPLPDFGWDWGWLQWYVMMLNDVDELGWVYLLLFLRLQLQWHGKYYFGDFVRRRLWVRMRQREKEADPYNEA